MSMIGRPCENCGSKDFAQVTPDNTKRCLPRVTISGADLQFRPSSGLVVDVYLCMGCSMVRLFATQAVPALTVDNES